MNYGTSNTYGEGINIALGDLNAETTFVLEVGARVWRESWTPEDKSW